MNITFCSVESELVSHLVEQNIIFVSKKTARITKKKERIMNIILEQRCSWYSPLKVVEW